MEKTDYSSNEDVEINRGKVLKIASQHGYPQAVIDGINEHFDKRIQKGLFRIVDGGLGQLLKVYENHCVLVTTEHFDENEISKLYAKLNNNSKGNFLSNGGAEALVRGLMTGSVVKAGISLATSAAVNVATNKIVPSRVTFKLVRGTITINYSNFDRIDYQSVGENGLGFLRFKNSNYRDEPAEDIVYFFCKDEYMKQIYTFINEKINVVHQPIQSTISVADEILKFKNLLDMGAITQEEFDKKKKELLCN